MTFQPLAALVLAASFLGWLLPATAAADDSPPASEILQSRPDDAAAGTQLEDPPRPFEPTRDREDADRARIEALSLFGAARMAEDKGKFAEALRLYQRALRHDPDSPSILWEIVAVAERLNRKSEMIRYAARAVEVSPADPDRLAQIGEQLVERGDYEGALRLYDEIDRRFEGNRKTPSFVMLELEMGRLRFLTGKYQEAADSFAEVLRAIDNPKEYNLPPNLPEALMGERGRYMLLFGEAFLSAELPAKARDAFERAARVAPDKARDAFLSARVLMQEDEPAKAIAALDAYFESKERDQGTAPYELLAEALEKQKQGDQLIPRLEAMLAADDENAPLRFFLAEKLADDERPEEAEALLASLLDRPARSRRGLAVASSLVELLHDTHQHAKLLDLFDRQIENVAYLQSMSDAVGEVAEDLAALDGLVAEADERLADKGADGPIGSRLALAVMALDAEEYDLAGRFFESALTIEKDKERRGEIYGLWAIQDIVAERYAEASRLLRRAIDEQVAERDNPTFHYYLATSLAMEDKIDEALKVAREALAEVDDSPRVEGRLPWILYHGKRYAEAEREYRKLVAKYADDYRSDEVRSAVREARLVLSNLSVIAGDIPQAEEWLEEVLDEFPEDVGALNDLGYIWADQGKNLERALEMVRMAVDAEPENEAYLDSLGWALFRLGRYQEAIAELKKATSGDEPDPTILDHLGDAYEAVGDIAAAVDCWERAAEGLATSDDQNKLPQVKAKLAKRRPAPKSKSSDEG